MNKYTVYVDLDSFTYYVKAKDEDTARALAVEAMEAYIEKHLNGGIGVADVVVDEDPLLEDSDIELSEGEQ